MSRRTLYETIAAVVLVIAAGAAHYLDATPVLAFLVAAAAIALLARLVGAATEQLGGLVGSSAAGVGQSGVGNPPGALAAPWAAGGGQSGFGTRPELFTPSSRCIGGSSMSSRPHWSAR